MRRSQRARREAGSAFVIALLVLVLLTFIGMSLALVTDTEMQLGGNERVINENFFATETAVSAAVAQVLVANDLRRQCFALVDRRVAGQNLGFAVETTNLYPVTFRPAPWSNANAGDEQVFAAFLTGAMRSRRAMWDGAQSSPYQTDLDDADAEHRIDLSFTALPLRQELSSHALLAITENLNLFGCEQNPQTNEGGFPPPPPTP